MLPDLQIVFLFICPIIESFEKLLIYCLAVGCVIIYRTAIIPNVLNKVTKYMEFRVVEG